MASFLTLLLLAAAPVTTSAQTVLGVYMFHRHGDRTPKSTPPANLTDLGYQEVFTSGDYYRNRYVSSASPLRISGINPDFVRLSQLSVSAPADNVLMSSALGFTQALYPPVPGASQILANGSDVQVPMNGYQLIPVSTVSSGSGSEDSTWLQSASDCFNAEVGSNEYYYSPAYRTLLASTQDFYNMLFPVINSTFNASQTSFKNAYTIYDYLNVAKIHNSSIPSGNLLDDPTMLQLRTLADTHEFNLAYNASSTIRAISGSTLAAQVVEFLNSTITGKGKQSAPKLGVQFGAYGNMQSFFGLAGLTATAGDTFYGVPDYASNLIWELYTNETVSSEAETLANTDNLHVRFLFHNGTTSNTSEPRMYPLFGQPDIDLSWTDFVSNMNKFAIGSTKDWCQACGNSTGVCASDAGSSSGNTAATPSSASGSGGMSKAVAGVVGAMVTLGVILLVEGLVLLLGGFRLVSKKRLAAGRGVANGVEK